jgi:hypothetical protein
VRAAHIQNGDIDCGMKVSKQGVAGAMGEFEQWQQRGQAAIRAMSTVI